MTDQHGTTLFAAAGADLFLDPRRSSTPPDAERFVCEVIGNFQLSARVTVDYHEVFDSAVVLCYRDPDNWIKICAELDPERRPRVVTVVTRNGVSDDANGWEIADAVYLRISRMNDVFALHASDDARAWRMARYFQFDVNNHGPFHAGILAQSPIGDGVTAHFADIRLCPKTLGDARDGS